MITGQLAFSAMAADVRLLYLMAHPEALDDLLHVDWSKALDYDMDCEKTVSDFIVNEVGFNADRHQKLKDSITA